MERVEKKHQEREYRFVVSPLREYKQIQYIQEKLHDQIEENIRLRELEGVNQDDVKLELQKLFQHD